MTPDKIFVRKLKEIDHKLEVVWETPLNLWVIYYKNAAGEKHRITEVKNADDSYRPLDDRTINMLKRCDMSRTMTDPGYLVGEQLRKAKEYKAQEIRKYRIEKQRQSQDKLSKWKKALDNAEKGIFNPKQLGRQIIYSIPTQPLLTSGKLLKKLGLPHLTGAPKLI